MDESPLGAYLEARIASAPYVYRLTCEDGSTLLGFSFRPVEDAVCDIFRDAIHNGKPVPTVLGRRESERRCTISPHAREAKFVPVLP